MPRFANLEGNQIHPYHLAVLIHNCPVHLSQIKKDDSISFMLTTSVSCTMLTINSSQVTSVCGECCMHMSVFSSSGGAEGRLLSACSGMGVTWSMPCGTFSSGWPVDSGRTLYSERSLGLVIVRNAYWHIDVQTAWDFLWDLPPCSMGWVSIGFLQETPWQIL